jgi:predicted transcriptional regulator YheO
MFVRDEKNKTIGCLCINYDITDILASQKVLSAFTGITPAPQKEVEEKNQENFTNNINEMFENIFNEALEHIGKPGQKLNREDNINITRFLDHKGIFAVKNSVETIAEYLGVSRYTIYNYLKEIK